MASIYPPKARSYMRRDAPKQGPKVSVLLPIHNAEATLGLALTSLLRQTFTSFEILAVDDGSTDGSLEILKECGRTDDRIRVVSEGRRGLVETLNRAFEISQGPLLARMDADDIAHPDRFQNQVGLLEQRDELDVVGCLVRCFPASSMEEGYRVYEGWLNSLATPEDIAREIFIESPLAHPSVVMRREILDKVGGYRDVRWPEDYDLWLRMHVAGARFAKVPRILLHWREGSQRLTRTDARYSVENFIRTKAHYLRKGPLKESTAIVWGAGQMGRRLSKHLVREGIGVEAFVDIDPKKIGGTRRGAPILSPKELPVFRRCCPDAIVLAAVPSRGARALIRSHLVRMSLSEGTDFICVA